MPELKSSTVVSDINGDGTFQSALSIVIVEECAEKRIVVDPTM